LSEEDAAEMDKKVADSEFAQKLIEHIRTRVMRKELSALAVEGDGIGRDANTVAEYLDHKLDPQQVAQLELLCFESDRHLAEVASSHQILTMVLGSPAHVSSALRKRVYGQLGNSMLLKTDSSSDLNAELTPDDQRWSTAEGDSPENAEEEREPATAELPIAAILPEEDAPEEEDERELATAGGGFGAKGWSLAMIVVLALAAGWLIAQSGIIQPPHWLVQPSPEQLAEADAPPAESPADEATTNLPASPDDSAASKISRDVINTLDDIPYQSEPGAAMSPPGPLRSGAPAAQPPLAPADQNAANDTPPNITRAPAADMPFSPPAGGPAADPPNGERVDPDSLEPGRRGVFLVHDITSDQYAAPPRGATLKPFQRLIIGPGSYFATTSADAGEMIVVGPADMLLTTDRRVLLNYGQISLPASESPTTIEVVGGLRVTVKNIAAGGEANLEVNRHMTKDQPPRSVGWLKVYSAGQCEVSVGDVSLPLQPADELIMIADDAPTLNRRKQPPLWSELYASPSADYVRQLLDQAAAQGIAPLDTLRRIAESNASPGVRSSAMRLSAAAGKCGPLVESFHDPTLSQFWSAHFQDLAEIWARAEPLEKPPIESALRNLSPQFADPLIAMLDAYWREELTQAEATELILSLGHHETAIRVFAFESLERMTGYTLLYRPDMTEAEREGPISRWWERMSAGQLTGLKATRTPK
ncbi:MAG: hypothetical protein ACIALR_08645, partial [Blastopirellula sp. JB062]